MNDELSKLEENKWYIFGEQQPPENRIVVIFRFKKRNLSIGYLNFRKENKLDEIKAGWDWITPHGYCHPVNVRDIFLLFSGNFSFKIEMKDFLRNINLIKDRSKKRSQPPLPKGRGL